MDCSEIDRFTVDIQNAVLDATMAYVHAMTTENREELRDLILSARATAGMDMDRSLQEDQE